MLYLLLTAFLVDSGLAATLPVNAKNYSGYQLWRLTANGPQQLDYLESLWVNETDMNLDFWQPPRKNSPAEVLVPPEHLQKLAASLVFRDIQFETLISNVQNSIEKKKASSRFYSASSFQFDDASQITMTISQYHTYEEIQEYLRTLQRKFPHLVQVIKIGTTHEGRTIDGVRITSSVISTPKKAMWIDAGIHAREWIAPSVALYTINQLVEKYEVNPKNRELVDNMIWYILPVVNPDGYEYSRIYDRMWRKNRSPNGRQFSESCKGVDLNRNFDFYWTGKGSSSNPCKEIYRGESPFSEPETQAIRDFVLTHTYELEGFITLHSYSQIWMYPFGHDYNSYPPDVNDLRDLALKAAAKVESFYGTHYIVDTGANALYPASGGSDDWSKGKAGIKYVYLIELRPNDYSVHGFLLPESQIIPTGKETYAGIVVIADEIMRRSGLQPSTAEIVVSIMPQQPQCVDREPYCRWWMSLGACYAWREQMSKSCPKSCNLCYVHK